MKKNNILLRTIGILVTFVFFGCYPVSHIVVGEVRAPILPSEVVILNPLLFGSLTTSSTLTFI